MNTLLTMALSVTLLASPVNAINARPVNHESPLEVKEIDSLDLWIEKLGYCESRGDEKAVNPHDAGSPSYGLLQFKKGTWETYSKKYNFEGDIFDGLAQRELARKILEEPGGWKHWRNCAKKLGIP